MNEHFYRSPTSAEEILATLLASSPAPTKNAPKDSRGVYGLVDHLGELRYIGSTSSERETFFKRIHQRHRTGSETTSHYFSRMYNTGRMWRLRNDAATKADGDVAKALRNAFIAEYCRAVWVPLPDHLDIGGLERAVIELAPRGKVAWNRRGMDVYEEPVELVDRVIARLGFGSSELAAVNRQRARQREAGGVLSGSGVDVGLPQKVPPFPSGPFRFFALDVETANHRRESICQIGVAAVRPDNTIETWSTYVNPRTDDWVFTGLHGIGAETVRGAPSFETVLEVLRGSLEGYTVYQHSHFDRSAIAAACERAGLSMPGWTWKDSVQVARASWPELKGRGGHGLASLKAYLGLSFEHHDAGEDARASAEVVLHAEAGAPVPGGVKVRTEVDDVIEDFDEGCEVSEEPKPTLAASPAFEIGSRVIGRSEITDGNIKNNHIYLRTFFSEFPSDAVGGSNAASTALRTISVDWGGPLREVTDLDGRKKFFRKRAWVREFFSTNRVVAGDIVVVQQLAPYEYRVSVERGASEVR